ncbi:MAG: hypothetical protein HY456_02075 [Parcubacteria group bacterium]|nr:hypothetical protein [Parcubacteria group bacterium]
MNLSVINAIIQSVAALLNLLAATPNIPSEIRMQAITAANQAIEMVNREIGSLANAPETPAANSSIPAATKSRAVTYNVSSNEPGPTVTKIVFDPDPLKLLKERETFQVWIHDTDGVADARAVIDTDGASTTIPLKLTEGTVKEGVWSGEWKSPAPVSTFSVYRTKFYLADTLGNNSKIEMNWTNN